jgi:hypothetical protein
MSDDYKIPPLSEAEKLMARSFGMSEEEYAVYKDRGMTGARAAELLGKKAA